MKNFTHFYCVIFVCCTSTGLASERPEFSPRGSGVEPAPSSGRNALAIQGQRKDPVVVIPGKSRETQALREGKEIHLKLEKKTFEGIEPHHFNEIDFTFFRHKPESGK